MAKRDEAFDLFSQGKVPTDPEVVALGLKDESAKKYYCLWKGQQEPEAVEPVVEELVPTELPVTSLLDGALFEYKGQIYKKKRAVYSGQVIADLMFKAYYTNVFTPARESAYLAPDTLVTPK